MRNETRNRGVFSSIKIRENISGRTGIFSSTSKREGREKSRKRIRLILILLAEARLLKCLVEQVKI